MKTRIITLIILFISCSWINPQSNSNKYENDKNSISGDIRNDGNYELFYEQYYLHNLPPDSLDKRIDLTAKDKKISEIINIISQKTGTAFVYNSQILGNDTLSVDFKNTRAKDILSSILGKYEIGFMMMGDKQVVLAKNQTFGNRNGSIRGKVTDEKGESLIDANVIILDNKFGSSTNSKGIFEIKNLKEGTYTVKASYLGYRSVTESVVVHSGKITEVNFVLQDESFLIGNIQVVAENEFIPLDPETKSKINSGEIEHMQAASLNDIFKLIPGTRVTNPTLNTAEKASIRGGDALGVQIIMDGIPISNNPNMQIGVGYSTANSGVDLRSIPAENIEHVEVIRGIPSAQYGDLIDGLMIVKNKSFASPLNAKVKYNPNVYEFNLNGGIKYNSYWVFNGNFNVASSDRDIRIPGDGYTRIALQLNTIYEKEELSLKNAFYYTRTFDEMKEQPGYALRGAWYNKDFTIKYNGNFIYNFSTTNELNISSSVSYTGRDSYKQQLVSRDNIVISDRTEEGSQEGRIVFGTYLGKQWIKGSEWSIYSDVNYKTRFFLGSFLNNILVGFTWRNEFNKGDGIIFDPLYPPSLSVPSPRIRTYNDLPAYNTLSIYFEDKITGNFIKPFTLQLGVRYEVYRPDGIDIKGLWGKGDLIESKNGSFLNPRLNFSTNLFEKTQLRLSYGITTKSPPMGMIFAQDEYFDIIDTVSVVDPVQPEKNFSIISTYVKQSANPLLKAYKQDKYEVSLDQQIGSVGFSFTGFINNSNNMFRSLNSPTVFYKYSFPQWPIQTVKTPSDTLLETYPQYVNDGYTRTSGVEFSFSTARIPVINTVFRFDASYYYERRGSESGYYLGSKRFVKAMNLSAIPMYRDYETYSKNLLINYRFDIQAKSLGIWLTLHIQQQLIEIDGRNNYDDILPIAYFTQYNELIFIQEVERNLPKYQELKRSVELFELNEEDRPNIWLFNLKVSKSLWQGTSVSFFVNNFFNNRPMYMLKRRSPSLPSFERRNPPIFYGMELNLTY